MSDFKEYTDDEMSVFTDIMRKNRVHTESKTWTELVEIANAMNAYAEHLSNGVSDAHESKSVNEASELSSHVSQQRELLINFMTMYDGDENSQLHPDIIKIIDTYLKLINCG